MSAKVRGTVDLLPAGSSEIGAVLLIVFGVVSLLALLNFSPDAAITSNWAEAIRRLFGYGGFIVAFGILALGVIILLPQFGVVLHFPWSRTLAIEISFITFLALLHLLANDPEPRALARAGGGGGYVGWALSQLIASVFDPITATIMYAVIFIVALSRALGLRGWHLTRAIDWLAVRLERFAENLAGQAEEITRVQDEAEHTATVEELATANIDAYDRRRRTSIVDRSAQNVGQPHVYPLHTEEQPTEPDTLTVAADAEAFVGEYAPVEEQSDILPSPARRTNYVKPSDEQLERGLSSPGVMGDRPSIVQRDDSEETAVPAMAAPKKKRSSRSRKVRTEDGRMIRVFRVDDLQEDRRVGKRDGLPSFEMLEDSNLNRPTDEEINGNVRIIEETLLEFDIHVEVVDVRIGPAVTQYAVQPFKEMVDDNGQRYLQRVRVGRITTLERDLALALSAKRLRIQAPVPGHTYLGVEVPNKQPSIVSLRGVLESTIYYRKRALPLLLPLGRDVSGESFVADLATMPHLLIAGTTGSGKSVALTSMTASLVMSNTPDRLKLVLLDPKMVELTRFNGLPHLLGPVETDQDRIIGVLRWATREMDRRYKLLEVAAARNIEIYNRSLGRRRKDEHLPYIVVIFDEIGDLMLTRPDETEKMLARLAQMARAVGIHLIVATQRPSVDVITGLIKANFPARISFAVASNVDSRVILDSAGAETLMGRGDMLYQAADAAGPQRLQGCFMTDEELDRVVAYWSDWLEDEVGTGVRETKTIAPWERGMTRREILSETDPMLEEAIQLVVDAGEASASLLQRRMGIGYPRAARVMDLLEELGIIGMQKSGGRTREVLYKADDDPFTNIVDRRIDDD
ncbi:DNA translocase FtsK [Chloroflexota bacterium]